MKLVDWKKLKIPEKPGVYFFKKGKDILYIGKATSLRDRTKSYFSSDLIKTRGQSIIDMVFKSSALTWQETDSVLEALILEAELIKKYQPYYNVKEKDNKSFLCAVITKGEKDIFCGLPLVLTVRKKDIDFDKKTAKIERGRRTIKIQSVYGPFTSGPSLKEALRIIRRIFPYHDGSSVKKDNIEFYKQLGLTPGYDSSKSSEYSENIKNIKLFFEGKKKQIIKNLEKEMKLFAKKHEFEKAHDIKKKLFALTHINDIALIKKENVHTDVSDSVFRIEAYDVAHLSGKNMVGVMTVIENSTPNKSDYRKFKINQIQSSNDVGALVQVLERRFTHKEWKYPNIIVVDGNNVQKTFTENFLKKNGIDIDVVSVVKDDRHKAREILGKQNIVSKYKDSILLANSEAHRFAITYHKQLRSKDFLSK